MEWLIVWSVFIVGFVIGAFWSGCRRNSEDHK